MTRSVAVLLEIFAIKDMSSITATETVENLILKFILPQIDHI